MGLFSRKKKEERIQYEINRFTIMDGYDGDDFEKTVRIDRDVLIEFNASLGDWFEMKAAKTKVEKCDQLYRNEGKGIIRIPQNIRYNLGVEIGDIISITKVKKNILKQVVVRQITGKTPLTSNNVHIAFPTELLVNTGDEIVDMDNRVFQVKQVYSSGSVPYGLITNETIWNVLEGYVPEPEEEPTYTVDEVKANEWLQKGNELWKSDKHDEAMRCYEKVIAMFPQSALAWDNKGRLAYVMKLYDLSIECMEQVMKFQEKHYDPLCIIANAHLEMKNFDKAMEYSDKAIGVWPKRRQAWEIMVATLKESGREEDVKVCQRVWDELQTITTTEEAQEFMKLQREDMRTGE